MSTNRASVESGFAVTGVIVVITIGLALAIAPVMEESTRLPAVAAVALVGGGAAALSVPVAALPAIALVLFALVPQRLIDLDALRTVPLPVIVMIVWLIRRVTSPLRESDQSHSRARNAFLVCTFAFLVYSTLSVTFSLSSITSISWTLVMFLGVFAPIAVTPTQSEARLLLKVWPVIGAVTALYAVIEFALQDNVVFDALYGLTSSGPLVQHWESYRSHSSFGHPLYAGAFFAASTLLSLGAVVSRRGMASWLLLGVNALGLLVTVSRGALLATGIGAGVLLITSVLRGDARGMLRRLLLVLIGLVAATAAYLSPIVQGRLGSSDVVGSNSLRDRLLEAALDSAEKSSWLGSGAGTSRLALESKGFLFIESSALQLLVSVGIPGLVLLCIALIIALGGAISHRNFGPLGALLAFSIAISTYNAIEDLRGTIVLLGLLVVTCFTREASKRPVDDDGSDGRRRVHSPASNSPRTRPEGGRRTRPTVHPFSSDARSSLS